MSSSVPEEGRRSSLDRGLALLDYLAQSKDASIAEILEATNISRSAAYRLIERLEEMEYITALRPGRWSLGPAVTRLAMSSVRSADIMDVAPELLRTLALQTQETVGLGVLSGKEIIFIYRETGPQAVSVTAELGARRPLHATSIGKAYLSGLDVDRRRSLLRHVELTPYTESTIVDSGALEQDILASQARGWSQEHCEFDVASACCGAPIFDHTGEVVAAVSVAGLVTRMENSFSRNGPLVSATAEAISRRLGHFPRR